MTFISLFVSNGQAPCFLSDCLVSVQERGMNPAISSRLVGSNLPFQTDGHMEISYARKAYVYDGRLCCAFSGEADVIYDFANNLDNISKASGCAEAFSKIPHLLGSLSSGADLQIIASIGNVISDSKCHWQVFKHDCSRNNIGGVDVYLGGGGASLFQRENGLLSNEAPDGILHSPGASRDAAIHTLSQLLVSELGVPGFLNARSGGGFHLTMWDKDEWRSLPIGVSVYSYIGPKEIWPAYVSRIRVLNGREFLFSGSAQTLIRDRMGEHEGTYVLPFQPIRNIVNDESGDWSFEGTFPSFLEPDDNLPYLEIAIVNSQLGMTVFRRYSPTIDFSGTKNKHLIGIDPKFLDDVVAFHEQAQGG